MHCKLLEMMMLTVDHSQAMTRSPAHPSLRRHIPQTAHRLPPLTGVNLQAQTDPATSIHPSLNNPITMAMEMFAVIL
jgi:hypothetical protein